MVLSACMLLLSISVMAQKDSTLYKEKFAQVNGISLHYLDFGGSGLPIIFLQSFHDDAREWVDFNHKGFAPKFTKTSRVYAITRRGWGKSTDAASGYDVASHSKDVIAFMDALNIPKAVLVGRVPACMDMTWVAEHHPQRVAGLVYWNYPYVPHHIKDSILSQYSQMMATMGCDQTWKTLQKVTARYSWEPNFLKAAPGSIAVPAISLHVFPEEGMPSVERRFFQGAMMMATQAPTEICDSTAREYFIAVSKSPELKARIEKALEEADRSAASIEAFKKAFTPALQTVHIGELPAKYMTPEGMEKFWDEVGSDFYFKHMSAFIEKLKTQ